MKIVSGIGLPEVITALAILAIGLLGTLAALTRGVALTHAELEARRQLRAESNETELQAMAPYLTPELEDTLRTELPVRNPAQPTPP